ncbi:hypothetical protein [Microvirga sp. M2]|uniref:hypothetical protein n=1 Tax=Microvirga sp. M2 TaxID=3073270 RepID=UPI0039C006B7
MTDACASGARFEDLAECLGEETYDLHVAMLIAAFRIAIRRHPEADLVEDDEERIRLDNIAYDIFTVCNVFGIDPRNPANRIKLMKCLLSRAYDLLCPRRCSGQS